MVIADHSYLDEWLIDAETELLGWSDSPVHVVVACLEDVGAVHQGAPLSQHSYGVLEAMHEKDVHNLVLKMKYGVQMFWMINLKTGEKKIINLSATSKYVRGNLIDNKAY